MEYASNGIVVSPDAARRGLTYDDDQRRGRRGVGVEELAAVTSGMFIARK